MRAGEKAQDLTVRQSFMTYLNVWIVNPDYGKFGDEQKTKTRTWRVGGGGGLSIILPSAPLLLGNRLPPNAVA